MIKFAMNYLEAFCVTNKDEFLKTLLKTVDITKASSLDQLKPIFAYLGRSKFESECHAMRLLSKLKRTCKWSYLCILL